MGAALFVICLAHPPPVGLKEKKMKKGTRFSPPLFLTSLLLNTHVSTLNPRLASRCVAFVYCAVPPSRCAQAGVALTASTYIPSEKFPPPPTLRITTNALHTVEQLEEAVRVLAGATAAELSAAKERTGSNL